MYENNCLKHFKKICEYVNCKIRYTIYPDKNFYYYDNNKLFDVTKDVSILKQFIQKCKFDLHDWNMEVEIGIFNTTETNYSDILFNREFKFLTRLDIGQKN